ncbi:unnamed protein product [Effrenium voratum]|uniref:Uncharacterized protein n=1 Tax=Effrenium voratum TaxID=2562239 RepID=A0AA36INK3_9DINO|nr:unnamed protein product [Effrenium voratum]
MAARLAWLSTALGRPAEDWWRCDQARSGGLDWRKLRGQMQMIAGWDPGVQAFAQQAHIDLMLVLYARVELWHRQDNDCPLGELSFRWLLLASQTEENLLQSFSRVMRGEMNGWLDSLLDTAWGDFWKLAASWHQVLISGWPIFALMGLLSEKLQRSQALPAQDVPQCPDMTDHLQRFRLALREEAPLPPRALEAALAPSPRAAGCAHARATVYVFAADHLRWAREEGLLPGLGNGVQLLRRAQALAVAAQSLAEIRNPWPLWVALDRLSCAGLVNVTVEPVPSLPPAQTWLWQFISPTRANEQDMVVSNRVRAEKRPYCSREFREVVAQVAAVAPDGWQPRVAEIGAHFGDCMLWSAAALPEVSLLQGACILFRHVYFHRVCHPVKPSNAQDYKAP